MRYVVCTIVIPSLPLREVPPLSRVSLLDYGSYLGAQHSPFIGQSFGLILFFFFCCRGAFSTLIAFQKLSVKARISSLFSTTLAFFISKCYLCLQPGRSVCSLSVLPQQWEAPPIFCSTNIQAQSFSTSHKINMLYSNTSIEINWVELSSALLPLYTSTYRDTSYLLLKDEARWFEKQEHALKSETCGAWLVIGLWAVGQKGDSR